MVKCGLDDGNNAIAYARGDDGGKTPICIFHYLRWRNDPEMKDIITLMKGKKVVGSFDSPHKWERAYLMGMEGPWRCGVCGLRLHSGMFEPKVGDTCPGERIDWLKLGIKEI